MVLSKSREKQKAIRLREHGLSYREILKEVPVAKSTLSLWLRDVGLSKLQKQRITQKRIDAALRGAKKKKEIRLQRTQDVKLSARKEVSRFIKDPLWLSGVMLYWAEGSKQKDWLPSQGVEFINMDSRTILLFIEWSQKYFDSPRFVYRMHIHERANILKSQTYWCRLLKIKKEDLKLTLKTHNPKTSRSNNQEEYHGAMKVVIQRSTDLNRRIDGWVEGVIEYLS
ncbi:MAG: hypothetical protein O2794_01930 [bacterium]|nr:hypothetical protein [bacterium]